VTGWANLTSASLNRDDKSTTVGELTNATISFSINNLPIDMFCLIQVTFPADMPLSSDLKLVKSSGFAQ